MDSLKDIYWMASPLAIQERADFYEKRGRFLKRPASILEPKKEAHFFRKIQHWTLEINGKCYELSPETKKKVKVIKKLADMCVPQTSDSKPWHDFRTDHGIEPERRKVGQTRMTHEEIEARIDVIWTGFNEECYLFFTQNCQNFVHMLHSSIAVGISDAEKKLWARIPDPISYRLADISQATLGGRAALGARAAYLAAVADQAVPVGMAAESTGAIGTVGVTSGGAASGGTAAAGGTSIGSGAAASVTTTAEGAGTASTAGGVGSQAAGVTQTAATGTAQSSVTSTVGTAKGAAAGGTSAGKASIGAKFAGLGQGAMHGAGAAKVGALAKVGTVAAFAHPVTGVVMTGGLIYLAVRGKRGKNWKPGSKKGQSLEKLDNPSVSDMLVAEDEFWDQAENSDKTMEEDLVAALEHHDQKVDEDLAEDLKLSLVTTEPTTMPEEMSLVGGAVPVGEGTKRSQTTV